MAGSEAEASISDVLSECRKTLFADGEQNLELMTMMRTMIELMGRVDIRLTAIETNTKTLAEVNKKLDSLTSRVSETEKSMVNFISQINTLEGHLQGNSNIMDGLKEDIDKAQYNVTSINKEVRRLNENEHDMTAVVAELKERIDMLEAKAIDAQCRSMKYNLIFHGIAEAAEGTTEDCETVLNEFIVTKLKDTEEAPKANVHRIGPKAEGRTRPIIAKFLHMKDLTRLKKAASNLRGTNFGVNEQFPAEIEAKRKNLYPIAKAERKEGRKAYIVRDKLFVDNQLVDPDTWVYRPRTRTPGMMSPRPHPPPRNKRARVESTPERE